MMCACGRPLHYSDPAIEAQVTELVNRLGEYVVVNCGGKVYNVSRHYIALHGLKDAELEALVVKGVIEKV